jgi:hypothetical protein
MASFPRAKVRRLGKHWWISTVDGELYGPYAKRADAGSDLKGMRRSMKNVNTPGYWTSHNTPIRS